ncbi:Death domain-associated protein 6 [Fasciola gigantica]|uniref:Death domain-associated protein 6 n=1 Tax=Fasciola gigantica TaxID=46835 RepID=A0A504Y425_FASGI|nr:Death domain-associated protein 6 [Fasciola gigantica]
MRTWTKFEEELRKVLPSGDEAIIQMLKRKFIATRKEFRSSDDCAAELRKCVERMTKQPHRVYTILNDLKTLLKHQAKNGKPPGEAMANTESKPLSIATASDTKSAHFLSESARENHADQIQPQITDLNVADEDGDSDVIILTSPDPTENHESRESLQPSSSITPVSVTNLNSGTSISQSTVDRRRAVVSRLERLLAQITKSIRKLEEQELDFDSLDSEHSPYIQLDVLKRRYLDVWRRLCEARKVARSSGRILRRRFVYTGCKYSSVNRMIENLVNDKKRFPDLMDIRRIVSHVNKQEKLQLRSVSVSDLARHVFIDVGHKLKQRRQSDLLQMIFELLLNRLILREQTPTFADPSLKKKISERNRHAGEAKLNSVFDKFVQLQQSNPTYSDRVKPEPSTIKTELSSSDSEPVTKQSKYDPDSDTSESTESSKYEVVSLSSDSDESVHENTSSQNAQPTLVKHPSEKTVAPCGSSILVRGSSPAAISPGVVTPPYTEPVIHLSDDEDDACTITDQLTLVPVSRSSAVSLKPFPPNVTSNCSSSFPRMPFAPSYCAAEMNVNSNNIFQHNSVYPVMHEMRSVTVTQRCTVGPGGVQTEVYQHASTTTSRVLCPPFTHPSNGTVPSNVCISSVRNLPSRSSVPTVRNRSFTRETQSHPDATNRNSQMPSAHSNAQFDHSGPIILD